MAAFYGELLANDEAKNMFKPLKKVSVATISITYEHKNFIHSRTAQAVFFMFKYIFALFIR